MDSYIVHGWTGMARGSLARIEDGKGLLLYVWNGELWITQEGDRRDYLVKARSGFRLDREGVTVLYATRRSVLAISAPMPAYYAKRITMALPGVPRVIYDRAQEPGGWLHGVRHRLSRLWINSYTRYSNPTAAL
jgi:Protein of unknown function (DUF2917)